MTQLQTQLQKQSNQMKLNYLVGPAYQGNVYSLVSNAFSSDDVCWKIQRRFGDKLWHIWTLLDIFDETQFNPQTWRLIRISLPKDNRTHTLSSLRSNRRKTRSQHLSSIKCCRKDNDKWTLNSWKMNISPLQVKSHTKKQNESSLKKSSIKCGMK